MLLVAVLLCAGCSRTPLGIVEGKVTVADKPLADVRVTFVPEPDPKRVTRNSSAVTDEDGHYRLVLDDNSGREGAMIGWHRVLVEDLAAENKREKPGPPRIHLKHSETHATPFKFEVKEGVQTINLPCTKP
ncbi:MAG: hypothetical protein L0Y71_04905 [Gemmataceae bacterium]|nr:hypothetical protein [Gemmataceae bacterium]